MADCRTCRHQYECASYPEDGECGQWEGAAWPFTWPKPSREAIAAHYGIEEPDEKQAIIDELLGMVESLLDYAWNGDIDAKTAKSFRERWEEIRSVEQ